MPTERLAQLKRQVVSEVDALHPEAVRLSHWLHAHPEDSFREEHAVEQLTGRLAAEGFAIKRRLAGLDTAFSARFTVDANHPHVAYLAEYDALPGLGHACGHNFIAATSWAASVAVARIMGREGVPGSVSLFGTPGAELFSGKAVLVDDGQFDDVDCALVVHPDDRNILDPQSMALDEIECSYHGTSDHSAAIPNEGRDALNAVLLLFHSVAALRQQLATDVRIQGIITHGGTATGVVPEFAQARFSCRANDRATLDDVVRRFRQCAEAAALATDTQLDYRPYFPSVDTIVHDGPLAAMFRANWELYVDEIEHGRVNVPMGGLDTGNISQVVPTVQPMVAAVPRGTRLHTEAFARAIIDTLADEALLVASRVLAMTGIDVLLGQR